MSFLFLAEFSTVQLFSASVVTILAIFAASRLLQMLSKPFTGHKRARSADGSATYEGDWVDGLYEGKGCYQHSNGTQYVGDFKAGQV